MYKHTLTYKLDFIPYGEIILIDLTIHLLYNFIFKINFIRLIGLAYV